MFDFEYIGNLHIHSVHSDGSGKVSEIADLAAKVGLDFICINDHAYMTDDLHLEEEGLYGKVLVFMGLEMGVRYNHYLAF
ncbi:MAG: PHP domain-containing protein, partial [Deltaproteobacteria bacterium]|nr:PHP domain-containing protein [Deltaproteobacteria bacterium]MBW1979092.1 PHP domain-containing protein [Deltaproteobacteria bacterium]